MIENAETDGLQALNQLFKDLSRPTMSRVEEEDLPVKDGN